jgi:hypothetical protein
MGDGSVTVSVTKAHYRLKERRRGERVAAKYQSASLSRPMYTKVYSWHGINNCLYQHSMYQTTLKSTGDGRYAHASVITGKFKC